LNKNKFNYLFLFAFRLTVRARLISFHLPPRNASYLESGWGEGLDSLEWLWGGPVWVGSGGDFGEGVRDAWEPDKIMGG
jgi:hypothetical protein